MKGKFFFPAALALPLLLSAAAPEITGLKHDAATGRTVLSWNNIPAKHGVVVFRSSRKLDSNGMFFAEKYYFDPGTRSGEVVSKGSGRFYYKISAINSGRRRSGELSAEKQLVEKDRTAPPPPEVKFNQSKGKLIFSIKHPSGSDAAKTVLLGKDSANGKERFISEFPAKQKEIVLPGAFRGSYAAVTSQDSSGNRAAVKNWFFCGNKMNLSISTARRISQNRDVTLENRYFLTGKPGKISFTIRNLGRLAGNAEAVVKVTEKNRAAREIFRKKLPSVAPGAETELQIKYTPKVSGAVKMELDFTSPLDADNQDNRLTLTLHSTVRPVYFLWYGGNVMDLEYANCAAVAASDIKEFTRRGGKPLVITGRTRSASGNHYWEAISRSGYHGMQLDEIGGTIKGEDFMPAVYDLKKKHPETFIAVWNIGPYIRPAIRDGLKKRKFELIMCELYFTDVPDKLRQQELDSLRSKVRTIVKNGGAENAIVGLATKANYRGWNSSPARQAEFVAQQIKVVRETAPEMPGIAFFSSDNDPEFLKLVDEACKKYFLE